MTTQAFPRAFAVWFKDLKLWSPSSFFNIEWHWPAEYIKPLSAALRRKQIEVDKNRESFDSLQLVTLHFDGTMAPRDLRGKKTFKGKLFKASAGDVIYSKIDVRNGAIGIVPSDMLEIAVSSEYPVYEVCKGLAIPQYIKLLFHTAYFRRAINGMISGASGRKRVQPEQIEAMEVPLPSLHVQQAIVDRWQQAQREISEGREQIQQLEEQVSINLLRDLGIPIRPSQIELPKAFALMWEELERWSVNYLARVSVGASDVYKSRFPVHQLGEIASVSYGIQKSPLNRPRSNPKPYLRVANVQSGALDLSEIKYIDVPDEVMDMFRLQKKDLLVCEGNSAELVGRPAIWNDEIPDCVHQNHILKVRVCSKVALPEFVLEYMLTPPARNYFRARAKFTTNLASINSNDLRELPVPIPPLETQRNIICEVKKQRAQVAEQRAATERKAQEIEEEIEALILGRETVAV